MEVWQEQLQSALKNPKDIESFFGVEFPEVPYPILIPRNFAKEIFSQGPDSALWKQFLPTDYEIDQKGEVDPLFDQMNKATGQLIHRYENRVLFMPTTRCPIICRYCFRKNELYDNSLDLFDTEYEKVVHYLKDNSSVNEIIFSGGDPLMLSDQKIKSYLESFAQIESIKNIRFHTRFPVILPQRLSENFIETLKIFESHFENIVIVIHLNHPEEVTPEFKKVINKIHKYSKVQLLSQSVLLKNINDNEDTLYKLFTQLNQLNIRPYYLHHPDNAKGAQHYKLTIEEGYLIYNKLRKRLSGWQLPQYVKEGPKGQGKAPVFVNLPQEKL